jgi:hypothetical protein
MKRFFAWLAGFLGGLGVSRALRRKPRAAAPAPVPPPSSEPDPAETLKAKLAEARAAGEPESPGESDDGGDVEERRRSVHERARSAIDEMQGPGNGSGGGPPPALV